MALNPETLREGDIVVFGKQVEQEVFLVSDKKIVFLGDCRPNDYYNFSDPIWALAELKLPALPDTVGLGQLTFHKGACNNYFLDDKRLREGRTISPRGLLFGAKMIVSELEPCIREEDKI